MMLIFSAIFLISLRNQSQHSHSYLLYSYSLLSRRMFDPVSCQSVGRSGSSRRPQLRPWAVWGQLYSRQSRGPQVFLQPLPALPVPVPAGGQHDRDDGQAVRGLGHDVPLPPAVWPGPAGGGRPRPGLLAALLSLLSDGERELVQPQAGAGGVPPLRQPARGDSLSPDWGALLLLPGQSTAHPPPPYYNTFQDTLCLPLLHPKDSLHERWAVLCKCFSSQRVVWRAVESIYQYDDELIIDQNGNIIGKWEDQHEDNQVEDEHSPEESI